MINIPSLEQAKAYLYEAEVLNPGPWVQHSIFVGEAARAIATVHPLLDPTTALILGYLHDIGRRVGVTGLRHTLDGYHFLAQEGYEDAARICLTHAFPIKDITAIEGKWDCSNEESTFVQDYLTKVEYDHWDLLIQLCDGLALPSGFCLLEKRFIDVALRYGVTAKSPSRWKAFLTIQKEFEEAIGCSVYSMLPGVIENTFGIQ